MEHPAQPKVESEHDVPQKLEEIDAIEIQQNEKANTDSAAESIEQDADHVTAKTWLVIFVGFLELIAIMKLKFANRYSPRHSVSPFGLW